MRIETPATSASNASRRDLFKKTGIGLAVTLVPGLALAQATSEPSSPSIAAPVEATPQIAYSGGYKASTAVETLDLLDLVEIEQRAATVIPKGGFGYISGGAGDEWTLRENRSAQTDHAQGSDW